MHDGLLYLPLILYPCSSHLCIKGFFLKTILTKLFVSGIEITFIVGLIWKCI